MRGSIPPVTIHSPRIPGTSLALRIHGRGGENGFRLAWQIFFFLN